MKELKYTLTVFAISLGGNWLGEYESKREAKEEWQQPLNFKYCCCICDGGNSDEFFGKTAREAIYNAKDAYEGYNLIRIN